jgi:hypothetical protein
MMMSAMMAAGRMRRRLVEGTQRHGPRGTVPSAATAQRHHSKRLHDVSLAAHFFFFPVTINAEAGWWTHFPKVFFSILR